MHFNLTLLFCGVRATVFICYEFMDDFEDICWKLSLFVNYATDWQWM